MLTRFFPTSTLRSRQVAGVWICVTDVSTSTPMISYELRGGGGGGGNPHKTRDLPNNRVPEGTDLYHCHSASDGHARWYDPGYTYWVS